MNDQNPYSSPNLFRGDDAPFSEDASRAVLRVGWVAILLIVHGFLLLAMSFFTGIISVSMVFAAQLPQNEVPGPMFDMMVYLYGGIAIVFAIIGCLQVVAGFLNYRYRRQVLGIVALFAGLVSMVGVFCAPTAIALLIYGMIIYLNDNVRRAFEMGDSGWTRSKIQASFLSE